MKLRILILALFASVVMKAHAEPPPCIPVVKGTMAPYPVQKVEGDVGFHFYWWCAGAPADTDYGFSCGKGGGCKDEIVGTLLASLNLVSDKAAATDTAWKAYVPFNCSADIRAENSDRGRMCVERESIRRDRLAAWTGTPIAPAPVVYRVKPNPSCNPALPDSETCKTRPAVTWDGTTLGTKVVARASVGALCYATTPPAPASGGDIRAVFGPAFKADHVTICAKVVAP